MQLEIPRIFREDLAYSRYMWSASVYHVIFTAFVTTFTNVSFRHGHSQVSYDVIVLSYLVEKEINALVRINISFYMILSQFSPAYDTILYS
jgi:hypothetical protein